MTFGDFSFIQEKLDDDLVAESKQHVDATNGISSISDNSMPTQTDDNFAMPIQPISSTLLKTNDFSKIGM